MFDSFGFENFTAPQAAIVFGLVLGLAFGALAETTRFCLRRGLIGPLSERRPALGVWLAALASATVGTQISVALGWISFDEHRLHLFDLSWLAISIGGLLFGIGMVLTRGCISRLTVLSGAGNMRALMVLFVAALTAHAAMKGVLAPARVALSSITADTGQFPALPGGPLVWAMGAAALLFAFALRSGAGLKLISLAVLLGLLVPLGWVGTGWVLFDDFDPIAMQSLAFTAPTAETLFWVVAATSIPAGFGTGLLGGVLIGAATSARIGGRFKWQSFESAPQTGRYMLGAVLMGFGGVLAGGCSVGAGLSGVASFSIAALLALMSIVIGAKLAAAALTHLTPFSSESSAPSTTPRTQPAE